MSQAPKQAEAGLESFKHGSVVTFYEKNGPSGARFSVAADDLEKLLVPVEP